MAKSVSGTLRLDGGRVVASEEDAFYAYRQKNRERAGVTHWPNSAMRHSFCSYWLAHNGDINKLCLFTGHDRPSTMFRHYHRVVTKAEAKKFWSIRPARFAKKAGDWSLNSYEGVSQ